MNQLSTQQLTVECCTDPAEWDEFIERNDGSPFTLWGWGKGTDIYGHQRWNLMARVADEPVGALSLVHMKSRLFGSQLVSPPFGERGSLVLNGTRSEEAAELLFVRTKALADDLGVDFVSLRGSEIEPQQQQAFTTERRFVTFDIPLHGGPEQVWESIKDSRQRQIRQAEDASIEYRVGESLDDLRQYYRLYLRSNRGHGTPPHSFAFFRTLWENLGPDHLQLGMVELDGSLINAIIDLSVGSTVYQWGVVTDYEHRDLNGGSLALWKSLENASETGHDTYEMGRTREGTGVYMFKKSFGGEKTWYDDVHYFPDETAELPHPEEETYEPLKKVWRRLPIPVTRVVGPRIRKGISL